MTGGSTSSAVQYVQHVPDQGVGGGRGGSSVPANTAVMILMSPVVGQ